MPKVIFNENELISIQSEIKDWTGIRVEKNEIKDILESNDYLYSDILECGFDTVARESFNGIIAEKLTEMDWPCNGDDEEVKEKFFKALEEASKDKKFIGRYDFANFDIRNFK